MPAQVAKTRESVSTGGWSWMNGPEGAPVMFVDRVTVGVSWINVTLGADMPWVKSAVRALALAHSYY